METGKKHRVLSAVLTFLCISCLFSGITSMMLRHTLSEQHIQDVISETKISELAIGDAVYAALQLSAETVDDADFTNFIKHFNENTTVTDLLYKVLKEENGEIRKKHIKSALDNKQFKKQLAKQISTYLDALLYDEGDGVPDAEEVRDLMEAFYDGMRLPEDDDEEAAAAWKEMFLDIDEEALEAISVKQLSETVPLAPLRVLVSPLFVIGNFALGVLLLVGAIAVNGVSGKEAVKKTVFVVVAEAACVGLTLLAGHFCGNLLVKQGVADMEIGDSMAEMVENLNEIEALERELAKEVPKRPGSMSGPAVVTPQVTPVPAVVQPAEEDMFNIYSYSNEIRLRMEAYFPGYVKINDTSGMIDGTIINFIEIPSDDEAYQNALDTLLQNNYFATPEERVDLFVLDSDFVYKYVDENADVAIKLNDLGIANAELADQYDYIKEMGSDQSGNIRATAYQTFAGVMIYNREIALEVLGSDDPKDVQEAVKDWDSFYETAEKMGNHGYLMTASADETCRVYANNMSAPWVSNYKISIDPSMEAWAKAARQMVDDGYTTNNIQWSEAWSDGFMMDGGVFCYFGPSWIWEYCTRNGDYNSVASAGGWAITEGPQSYYWGGSWIAAANGTTQPLLAERIIRELTLSDDNMHAMAVFDHEPVNNRTAMAQAMQDSAGENSVLGGQNPYEIIDNAASQVDVSMQTEYDTVCNQKFMEAMRQYISGIKTYDEACDIFYQSVELEYPQLTH